MDTFVMLELAERLKNSDLFLKAKVAELNQNKNSKQSDQIDAGYKFVFPWK